jgi:hypothetical protein
MVDSSTWSSRAKVNAGLIPLMIVDEHKADF